MDPAPTFTVGTVECAIVSDGWNDYEPETIFLGIPEEEWRAVVGDSLVEGLVRTPYQVLLLRLKERWILFDAGLGDLAGPDGTGGKLRASLGTMSVQPGEIAAVVVSHGHPDHIGGLIRLGGDRPAPAFPNARVLVSRAEHHFWTTAASASAMPMMREVAAMVWPTLGAADLLDIVDGDEPIFPGVRLVPAPGHTPGHSAILIEGEGGGAIYVADGYIHTAQLHHPDWTSLFDADPTAAVRSRRHLLDIAVERWLSAVAFHVGGRGRIRAEGDAYRLEPES